MTAVTAVVVAAATVEVVAVTAAADPAAVVVMEVAAEAVATVVAAEEAVAVAAALPSSLEISPGTPLKMNSPAFSATSDKLWDSVSYKIEKPADPELIKNCFLLKSFV